MLRNMLFLKRVMRKFSGNHRIEHDSMGEIKVPSEKYWGAQT